MKLRNVNPLGAVELHVLGHGSLELEAGQEFDVPDAVAGHAPHWRPVREGEVVPPYLAVQTLEDVLHVLDPGEGLLAQVTNYVPAEPIRVEDVLAGIPAPTSRRVPAPRPPSE